MTPVGIQQVLLDCLSARPNAGAVAAITSLAKADTLGLLKLARRQGVSEMLFKRLRTCDSPAIAELQKELNKDYLATAVSNVRLYAQWKEIARAFDSAGVPLIALKGVVLAESVYGDIGARSMVDIDVLVPRSRLADAASILSSIGYRSNLDSGIETIVQAQRHLPAFKKPGAPFGVEVHWTIQHPDRQLDIDPDRLFERSTDITLGGVQPRQLCAEDLLLHLGIHTAYEDEFLVGIRQLCDIALSLERYADEIDWAVLRGRADSWNALRGAALAITMAQRWLGAPVPDSWLDNHLAREIEQILPVVRKRIFNEAVPDPKRDPSLHWIAMASRRSVIAKSRLLLRRGVPSRARISTDYGVRPSSWRIIPCYLRQWGAMGRRYIPLAWDSLRLRGPEVELLRQQTAIHAWLIGDP